VSKIEEETDVLDTTRSGGNNDSHAATKDGGNKEGHKATKDMHKDSPNISEQEALDVDAPGIDGHEANNDDAHRERSRRHSRP
jgi:hypothetical protein